jgi:hydroxyacylglutathione hydrolase
MIQVKTFTFNSFEENTYVLSDETGECIIIDPGCHLPNEEQELSSYIAEHNLNPVKILNTHCHIDHILGNQYVSGKYNLKLSIHKEDEIVLNTSAGVASAYGISMNPSPGADEFLVEGDIVKFGNSELKVLFTPGHSPGSISFYSSDGNFVISGDVLFEMSIGRTDLPGGNYATLMNSIVDKLLPLGDDVKVYSGHGRPTTIGQEKSHNPFLLQHFQN